MSLTDTEAAIESGGAALASVHLHLVGSRRGIDLDAAEAAAASFLTALGIDLSAEGVRRTPARMARAYAELFTPRDF